MTYEYDLIPVQHYKQTNAGNIVYASLNTGSGKVFSVRLPDNTCFNVCDGENVMRYLTPGNFPGFDNSKADRKPYDIDFRRGINVQNCAGKFIGQLESIDFEKQTGKVLGLCTIWYDDYAFNRNYSSPKTFNVSELFFADTCIDNYQYK